MNIRTLVAITVLTIAAFITGYRRGSESGFVQGFRQGRVQTLIEEGYSFKNIVRQHGDLSPPISTYSDD